MTILVVTHSNDEHCTPRVMAALARLGADALRLDTDLYPLEVRLATHLDAGGTRQALTVGGRTLDLSQVKSIYHRRDETARTLPHDMDRDLRGHAVAEARRVLQGCLAALPCFHLDAPEARLRGRNKQLQLELAARAGLPVPRTLITNDPDEARAFVAACPGGVVTKMMNAVSVWDEGEEHALFTNLVRPDDVEALDDLVLCPMTFQEKLEKALELRVTVVGDEVFSASIDSQSSARARVDWRRDGLGMIGEWRHHDLPREVGDGARALLDTLGLTYGAFDYVLTPDGRYVFLEVNPEGEFFWLEDAPGLPISDAIARALVRGARV